VSCFGLVIILVLVLPLVLVVVLLRLLLLILLLAVLTPLAPLLVILYTYYWLLLHTISIINSASKNPANPDSSATINTCPSVIILFSVLFVINMGYPHM